MVGTATRMMSQPAASKARIWLTVAFTSSVFVLHMDWIRTGFPPPIFLSPMEITFVCSLYMNLPPLNIPEIVENYKHHKRHEKRHARQMDGALEPLVHRLSAKKLEK